MPEDNKNPSPNSHVGGSLIGAAERYMLSVKQLGEDSGYNRLSYFEAPISRMPTDEMAEEATARWVELNNSGKALTAAVTAAKDSPSSQVVGLHGITKEWFERRAKAEGDLEIGAGFSVVNPTDADIAQMEVVAERALPQWAQDELSRLRTALAKDSPNSILGGWQPICTAPKDGTEIILYHPKAGVCAGFCPKEGWAWHVMDGQNTYIGPKSGVSLPNLTSFMSAPTHWMLLPAGPTKEASDV